MSRKSTVATRADSGVQNPSAPLEKTDSTWSVAEAMSHFSEVIERASDRPQTITKNGKPVSIVVSIEEWKRKTERKGSLVEFFLSSPLRDSDLEIERIKDEPRDIEL